MLAFPTPTFDAKTILQAPGFRPIGKSGSVQYEKQPEAVAGPSLVNRHTTNGGYVGTRAKKFIQDNQFLPSYYDPLKGSPLSEPGSVGNVGDLAIGCSPKYAEPENGELKAILNILNGKPNIPEHIGKLSAKQIESLSKKVKNEEITDARKVVSDFSDAREALRKEEMIRKAVRQGFTMEEAKNAYGKMRLREAETALFKEEDPSTRLYDLIDSKVSGTQNGSIRSNDETGLFLAKGGNAILVKQAENRDALVSQMTSKVLKSSNMKDDVLAETLNPRENTKPTIVYTGEQLKVNRGRKSYAEIAKEKGLTKEQVATLAAEKRIEKKKAK